MYRQGWWSMSRAMYVGKAMGISWFNDLGLFNLTSNFDKFYNYENRRDTRVRPVV
jgi:hypothetical protein